MQDSFGMMDGAYFVSRIDLLGWINDLLQVRPISSLLSGLC